METVQQKKAGGGRPPKKVKRDQQITVMCNLLERKAIAFKAKQAGVTLSEYLRVVGLCAKIDSSRSELAKEILLLKATCNHAAENINQFTRKLHSTGFLSQEDGIFYYNATLVLQEVALLIKNKLL